MLRSYMCVNKFRNINVGDFEFGFKHKRHIYDMLLLGTISKSILDKHFIEVTNVYSFKFKTKSNLGFTKVKRYNINLSPFTDDIVKLIYKKIILYIRKVELLDEVFINSYKNVIIDICDNLMAISKLTQNYEDNFNTLKIAIDEAEGVFKAMYKTSLNQMKEADLMGDKFKSPLLDRHKKTISIYTEMFRELNEI